MGEGSFLDIIFLAMVAAFIFFRLRGVLGRRTGHERQHDRQRPDPYHVGESAADDNVISLPDRGGADATEAATEDEAKLWAEDSPVGSGLTQIKIADHRFEPAEFLGGARAAYEMVVGAFAEGDREALRGLLNDEVHDNFVAAIEEREEQGQSLETTIVAINSADIVEAELQGKMASVTVKFVSEMVSVLRDEDGETLPGQPGGTREVTDIWTFARDTSARDPNWLLIETRSEN
ncbi:MAG: Tim44/TimA family putative adaptor protein [Alphaproteobacteria bacterium]|jgi:predicted lipid-binding transport protein (Tim44 family)|nr:Tim44/TimA family putative adaptor protein [Alphaproteobacteria bacterium]MDP6565047.1 Tim44/TimA family putative adaptor protein [Alphaproteobacteria bacterium]MDP6815063.1 Tim44/TimA family putative adaptor protein [Alphaproteobacteria bacterium]